MLLTLTLAAPASAATWRSIGAAVAQGDRENHEAPWVGVDGQRRDVSEIQIGFRTYGQTRTVEYDYYITCWNNNDYASKSRAGKRQVDPGAWRWMTVWSRSQRDVCTVHMWADMSNYSTLRTKVRAR